MDPKEIKDKILLVVLFPFVIVFGMWDFLNDLTFGTLPIWCLAVLLYVGTWAFFTDFIRPPQSPIVGCAVVPTPVQDGERTIEDIV